MDRWAGALPRTLILVGLVVVLLVVAATANSLLGHEQDPVETSTTAAEEVEPSAPATAPPTSNPTSLPSAAPPSVAPSEPSTATPTATADPTPLVGGPGGECARPIAAADVDGDGVEDPIGEGRDEPELVVCLTTGDQRVPWPGAYDRFGVGDVDGDGLPELFFGESGPFGTQIAMARWDDEALVLVEVDGDPVVLRSGTLAFDAGNQPAQTATWGCGSDGMLVTVDAFREDVVWEVVTTTYELDGDRLRERDDTTTEVEVEQVGASRGGVEPVTDPTVATIRPCGDGTAFPEAG